MFLIGKNYIFQKTINANSATAAPSFMKLSKVGQKIPERRGGSRVSNPTLSSSNSSSPANDEKENKSKKPTEQPTAKSELIPESLPDKVKMKEQAPVKCAEQPKIQTILPSSHCIFHPTDVSKIILGPDGGNIDDVHRELMYFYFRYEQYPTYHAL